MTDTLDTIPGKGQYTEATRQERLAWLRGRSNAALSSLDAGRLEAHALTSNIENFVAAVEVPVGLAGPLTFVGEHARGDIVAPLATTEGALVASASRGARAVTLSGGVTTRVLAQRTLLEPGTDAARLARLFRRCTGRGPQDDEPGLLDEALRNFRERYRGDPQDASALAGIGEAPAAPGLAPEELAAWTMVASAVLSLSETITQR